MKISADEIKRYHESANELLTALGVRTIPHESTLWHYTNGPALIEILKSGSIFSTQLSGLNDTTELRYASKLFRDALAALRVKYTGSNKASLSFFDRATAFYVEHSDDPLQAYVPFFVACFSEVKDDLSQWRAYGAGENGYAIGFKAKDLQRTPNSLLGRVNYRAVLHEKLALKTARKARSLYVEGLRKVDASNQDAWARQFLYFWDDAITNVAPFVKDPCFAAESEFRIVRRFLPSDTESLEFRQKASLMSRHLPLHFTAPSSTGAYRLPIAEVMVGPCRHPVISHATVKFLLEKHYYNNIDVSTSKIPFQTT